MQGFKFEGSIFGWPYEMVSYYSNLMKNICGGLY